MMSPDSPVAFLLDVDNTLLDNDRIERDIKHYLDTTFGPNSGDDFWKIFEEVRAELGYADYFGALQRYRIGRLRDPRILDVSSFLIDYRFADCLYPRALDVIGRLRTFGPTVIVSDGDAVFQPRKVRQSGLWKAVDGHVLIYIHKENMLDDIAERYPADRYVMIDDKIRVLAEMKKTWRDRLTTVFVRQGHYARDKGAVAQYPPADLEIEDIEALLQQEVIAALSRR
ncbi:MAG: HAD family hydrolase [Rhodoplanes sp.]